MVDIDRRLATIASRQRMLITAADVAEAGGLQHHVKRRLQSGRWRRVDSGVYLIAGASFDWATQELAVVLAAGRGARGSHFAAAHLLGVPGFGNVGLELSIPRGRRYRRAGVRCHESTDLHLCGTVIRQGIPITGADRTLLDLGRYLGIRRLSSVVEAARRLKLVTWQSLIAMHTAHARQGRHGICRLRAVITTDAHRAEITDTDVELLLLGLIRSAGLPEPVLHHRVVDGDRFVAEVDLAYPGLRIAIEAVGGIHGRDDVRERDMKRRNDLLLTGWVVLEFSNARILHHPNAVVEEIRSALRAARRAA